MKTLVRRFVFTIIIIVPILGYSQTRKLTGTVVCFNKYPVNNITVEAKKAKTEAVTNENGEFEIEVKNNDVIRIRESVFLEYNQKVTEETESLKINLIFENSKKNVEVATNAGFISKEDLEYGLEYLFQENSFYSTFTDAYQAILYALPESVLIVENGQKGIQFRGPKTITGSNAALILVDGVIADDVSFVNPVQIISITKLSSSAASLYGGRGGNGVISIRTR